MIYPVQPVAHSVAVVYTVAHPVDIPDITYTVCARILIDLGILRHRHVWWWVQAATGGGQLLEVVSYWVKCTGWRDRDFCTLRAAALRTDPNSIIYFIAELVTAVVCTGSGSTWSESQLQLVVMFPKHPLTRVLEWSLCNSNHNYLLLIMVH